MKRMLTMGVALLVLNSAAHAQNNRKAPMQRVETPYYVLHTDLSPVEIREADIRMTRMFEEYQRVTSGFAEKINRKFDFYLFRFEADYRAMGGPEKSAGVFIRVGDSRRLMAWTGGVASAATWDTIQHEGFHQFADYTIKADLPTWVNEGLAEYFGQAIWTGDGFITGLVPRGRQIAVRRGIQQTFKPFRQFMKYNNTMWQDDFNSSNYDQAWAMTHFLAHADNGRFVQPFGAFMNQVAHGTEGDRAWENVFGRDVDGFQNQFANWWMNLPEDPTQLLYTQAMVQTLTSFLARAALHRQQYPDAHTFFSTFDPEKLTATRDLWLPPSMWNDYKEIALNAGGWKLENGAVPKLSLTLRDGTVITCSYTLGNGKVQRVGTQVTPAPNARPNTR